MPLKTAIYDKFTLETLDTNGIKIRAAVEGSGPLIVLVHGWPELWYSWRHQIKPLASEGYQVVAIDVRGYGGSDKPHEVCAYDMSTMMADVLGVIDHFGEKQAILVGHDWGAPICWNTAALHPKRVAAVAGLSVPYLKRGPIPAIELFKMLYADKFFYQLYFQQEGIAEAELEHDVRTALRKVYFSASGDIPDLSAWSQRLQGGGLLQGMSDPEPFPDWMGSEDIDYFVDQFEKGGFRGPLNRYRNFERDFELLPNMGAVRVEQPSCFIAGSKDLVRYLIPGRDLFLDPGENCTDMRFSRIIDNEGHWIQQEAPDQVTGALREFLATLP